MTSEDYIEKFIRENKDELGASAPPESHMEKFLMKLNKRIRHLINIVPYLVKVLVVTVIVFAASIIIWNNYIRKDKNEITLRDKITIVIRSLK